MIKTIVQNQVFIQVLLKLLLAALQVHFIQKVADPDLPSTCTLLISPNTGAKVKFDIILIISIEFYHALEQRKSYCVLLMFSSCVSGVPSWNSAFQ